MGIEIVVLTRFFFFFFFNDHQDKYGGRLPFESYEALIPILVFEITFDKLIASYIESDKVNILGLEIQLKMLQTYSSNPPPHPRVVVCNDPPIVTW
jgi:hypothetical protein